MTWFDRLFPPLMLIFPAVLVLFSKRHERLSAEDAAPLTRRLYLLTALALVVTLGVQWLLESTHEQRTGLRAAWPIVMSVVGFQYLWFKHAVPALGARDPGWRPTTETRVRSASLTPRHVDGTLSLGTWISAWVAYAVMVAASVWAALEGAPWLFTIGLVFFPGFALGARSTSFDPATLDPGGSEDLERIYRELRVSKARGFLLLGLFGSAVFTATMVLVVLKPEYAAHAGAFGGALVGLLGGLFGLTASMIRARANRLLAETLDEQTESVSRA